MRSRYDDAPVSRPQTDSDVDWRGRHATLCQMFEESEEAGRTNRGYAERDIDYYDNKQWTEEEVKALRRRGQAALMDNRIRPKMRYLQGLEQAQRTDPRALPRTQQHEQDAESATDALRYVCSSNRYDQARSKAWKDILLAGWGGVEVGVEQARPGRNPRITLDRCPWDRMFWDPYSSRDDFSDASYRGLQIWMDREEAIRKYGGDADKVFAETLTTTTIGSTFDDKPKITTWVSYNKRYRVRVAQMYYLDADGVWQFVEFTKGGILTAMPSPWLDDDGQPEDPYSWRSANIDRDNNRYGEIRELLDLQDSINKKKSKFQHLMSVRQTFASEQALGSMTALELRKELAKPDGHVQLAPGIEFGKHFGIIPTGDMAEAQFKLLEADIGSMNVHGANAAMQGKDPRDQSGRAILAQQQGGANEISPILDELREMDHEAYRKVWRRIRQFWTAPDWIRVTDDERNLRWVGINLPAIDPMSGQPIVDPMTGQQAIPRPIAQLEVDIEIDDAPHVGTMQQEEFAQLVEAAKAGLPIPPKIIIQASSFRNKGDILKALGEAEKAAQQQPNPAQIEAQKAEAQLKIKQVTATSDLQAKQEERAMELQFRRDEHDLEMQQMREKAELEMLLATRRAEVDSRVRIATAKQNESVQ